MELWWGVGHFCANSNGPAQSAPERLLTTKMTCTPMFGLPVITPAMIVPAAGASAITMGGVNLAGFFEEIRSLDVAANLGTRACSARSVCVLFFF